VLQCFLRDATCLLVPSSCRNDKKREGLMAREWLTDRFRGESLLHWSARHGLKAETAALIGKGANAGAPNGDGRRPYEVADDLELRGLLRSAAFGGRSV